MRPEELRGVSERFGVLEAHEEVHRFFLSEGSLGERSFLCTNGKVCRIPWRSRTASRVASTRGLADPIRSDTRCRRGASEFSRTLEQPQQIQPLSLRRGNTTSHGLTQLEQLSSTVREFRIFFVGEFGVSRLLLETEWAKRGWDVL